MIDEIVTFRLKRPNYAAYLVFGIILMIFGIGLFILFAALVAKAKYESTFIEITRSSVRLRKKTQITEIPFTKINSVTMGVISTRVTYGDLTVSLGNDIVGLKLLKVENVRALNELIQNKISGSSKIVKIDAPSRIEDLERLARLRKSGALTDIEYRTEKARLLK